MDNIQNFNLPKRVDFLLSWLYWGRPFLQVSLLVCRKFSTTEKEKKVQISKHHLKNIFQTLFLSSIVPPFHRPKLSLGDLTSGKAFDNGCSCFDSCKAAVNDLKGKTTYCEHLNLLEVVILHAKYFNGAENFRKMQTFVGILNVLLRNIWLSKI